MDVIDEGKLRDQLVKPTLDRLESQTIPALQQALDHELLTAGTIVRGLVDEAVQKITTAGESLLAEARELLKEQDGWTLEIGPITIPAITIRLTKPSTQLPLEPKQ